MSLASTRPRAAFAAVALAAFAVLGVGFAPPVAAQTPTISNAFPPALPGLGGSRLTITGANFGGNGGSVSIQGREVAVPAGADWAPTTIRVIVPAGDPGSAPVIVRPASGPPSATHFGPFYGAPQLFDLDPDHGPAAGGTRITITGSNFGTPTAVGVVRFGGVEVPMIPIHPGEVQAIAPPRPPGSVQAVSVVINEQSSGTLSYAVDAPAIDSFEPWHAPTAGGVVITIYGSNFGQAPDPEPVVKFGGIVSPFAARVSPEEIRASVPAGAGIDHSLLVQVGGVESAPSAQEFSYDPPEITTLDPTAAPGVGGMRLTLHGLNFGPPETSRELVLQPLGGGVTVHGVIEAGDHGQVEAQLPALAEGAHSVRLFVADQPSNVLVYQATGPPTIMSVSPPSAPSAGGVRITIEGTNFGSAGGIVLLQHRQIDIPAGPDWTPNAIQLDTPDGDPGPAPIEVLPAIGPRSAPFAWSHDGPLLDEVQPASVPAAGGTVLTIIGSNFGTNESQHVARMGGKIALCTRIANWKLEVVAPNLPPGVPAMLEVEVNGIAAPPRPVPVASPVVSSIEPPTGPTVGGVPLTIHGLNFGAALEDPEPTVTLGGHTASSVVRLADDRIECLLPAGAGTSLAVVVTVGPAVGDPGSAPFHYDPPHVDELIPSSGPAEGGVRITIHGLNFGPPGTQRLVHLRDTSGGSTPMPIDEGSSGQGQVVATVPALAPGTYEVFLEIAGQQAFAGAYDVQANVPEIASLSSPNGPTEGGVPITIYGTGFGDAPGVVRIGLQVITNGTWSSTEIAGLTPAGWPGKFPVTVERAPDPGGGGGGSGGGVQYTYDGPVIAHAQPDYLDPAGGVPITIVGENFGTDGAPRILLIGGAPATLLEWRSHHEIVVQSPAGTPGTTANLCMQFPGVAPECVEVAFGNPVDVSPVFVPIAFGLRLAGANPSRGSTALAIDLPREARWRLRLFDPAGRVVRTFEGEAAAGAHTVRWDGADLRGTRVPAGLYWARLDVAGEKFVRKVLRL